MTVNDIARFAKVSKATLTLIESGRLYPYPLIRKRLAAFFGVREGELFRDVDAARRYLETVAGK